MTYLTQALSRLGHWCVAAGRLEFCISAMTATTHPILNNMGGRCLFERTVDTAAKATESHGFCAYVDKDGDQIFEKCASNHGLNND